MGAVQYILCAAIHNPIDTDMAGYPLIYCGHRHNNILWQGNHVSRQLSHQGFLTNEGKFVDRKEAAQIAFKAGQIRTHKIYLYSEDLY